MRKLILEFEDPNDYAALAAIHSMRMASSLSQIAERARTTLKHDGDLRETLEEIRSIALNSLELLE